jgi:hypothetical protein
MGRQLPLPIGWARRLESWRDPKARLDELLQDELDAKADIRTVLDRLAAKHHVVPRDIDAAMEQATDLLSDFLYPARTAIEDEIDEASRA